MEGFEPHLNGLGPPDSADNVAGVGGVPPLVDQNVLNQQKQP